MSACLVYDDRHHARTLLARVLAEVPGVRRVVAVASVDALMRRDADGPGQLVFVGTRRGSAGIDAIRRVLAMRPRAAVIAVGGREDAPSVSDALAAGAAGFLRADASPQLAFTLIQSLSGTPGVRTPPGPAEPAPGAPCDHPTCLAAQQELGISRREMQVLGGISRGLGNAELGRELDLSENTVKSHVRGLFLGLGVHERAHAVARAYRSGLFACPPPAPRGGESRWARPGAPVGRGDQHVTATRG